MFRGLRTLAHSGNDGIYLGWATVNLLAQDWCGHAPPAMVDALTAIGTRAVEIRAAELERYRARDAKRAREEMLARDPVAAEAERAHKRWIGRAGHALAVVARIHAQHPEEFATLERAILEAQTRTGVVL